MAFSTFEVGEFAQNEEGDFVAQITAIGKEPVRWMEMAISDYVTGLAENMVSGGASLEETGHYHNRHRIIKVNGSDFDHVRDTANALCEYICSQLAELRLDYGAREWNKLRAQCRKEAAKGGDKTAQELFDERRKEREQLQEYYFSEKKERERRKKKKKEQRKRKRERSRSEDREENTSAIGENATTPDYDKGGDFMAESERIKIRSKSTLPPREMEEGANIIDEDGDLVAKVMRLDLSGDPKWVELAISEFTVLPVEEMRCYCADSSTTMEETGQVYAKVNRILRIESASSRSLAMTLDELCEFIRYRLTALREREMTEEDWKNAQETCEFLAKQEGCTQTAEQMLEDIRQDQEAFEARYKAQREERKKRERREKQKEKERKTREAR